MGVSVFVVVWYEIALYDHVVCVNKHTWSLQKYRPMKIRLNWLLRSVSVFPPKLRRKHKIELEKHEVAPF